MSTRALVVATLVSLLVLGAAAAAAGATLREPLLALGHSFVQHFGGPGVAAGYFLPDAFTIPLPNDAVGLAGLAGGLSFGEVVMWGTAGSVLGGCTGYGVGRGVSRIPRFAQLLARRGEAARILVARRGAWGLAAAALTPLPYSVACWACGALAMPFPVFVAVSSLRVIRVAGYLALVRAGFFGLGG